MLPIETESRIPRNLLTIINNILVINDCQQVLAEKTPKCVQLGLITKIYMDLLLALRAKEFTDKFVYKYVEMTS